MRRRGPPEPSHERGRHLGVVAITRGAGGLAVGGRGTPVEWATLMRRLPADDMLEVRLKTDRIPPDLVERLAGQLIAFHLQIAGPCPRQPDSSTDKQIQILTDNLAELRPFAGAPLSRVQLDLVELGIRSFLDRERGLLEQRGQDGWIRDGHGDLRAEHICVERDQIQIFDCVEFSSAIRCADIASDLAFLLVDLTRLGAAEIAAELEARYRAAGVDLPRSLLRVYQAHRALVRVKANCLAMANQVATDQGPGDDIRAHLNLATWAALTFEPFLVVMTGLSGTGKSTVARSLAQATGAALYATDAVRKQLAGVIGAAAADWDAGIYSSAWTDRTYARLEELARESLRAGRPVILDGTFLDSDRRRAAAAIGAEVGVPVFLVETVCDEAIVAARLDARSRAGQSMSDATRATHQRQRMLMDERKPGVPEGVRSVTVDTSEGRSAELDPVLLSLRETGVLKTHPAPGEGG